MDQTIRWGLLGAGNIANRWLAGFLQTEGDRLVAVASRNHETAEKMAKKWNIPRVMTLNEMVESPEIDAVYIPVPHPFHKELAMLAMSHHKAVLVEKPGAVNAADFVEMATYAKAQNTFLMEGVWTRFFPAFDWIHERIACGDIGELRCVQSNFSFRVEERNTKPRCFLPALAGGGLLDVGVYPMHFSSIIFGEKPVSLVGAAEVVRDEFGFGVDEQGSYIAMYSGGGMACGSFGVNTNMVNNAVIYGSKGRMEIPEFWKPNRVHIVNEDRDEMVLFPVEQKVDGVNDLGFQYEIRHVNECLRNGLNESPVMTHALSLEILNQCDELRRQWNMPYPFEKY